MNNHRRSIQKLAFGAMVWFFVALMMSGWFGFYVAQTVAQHFMALGAFAVGAGGIGLLCVVDKFRGPSAPRNVQLQPVPPAIYDKAKDNAS